MAAYLPLNEPGDTPEFSGSDEAEIMSDELNAMKTALLKRGFSEEDLIVEDSVDHHPAAIGMRMMRQQRYQDNRYGLRKRRGPGPRRW